MSIEVEIEGEPLGGSFDFVVRQGANCVPSTFWKAPEPSVEPPPLVLLQHGGPFHKRHERSDWLSQEVTSRTGAAVLLIDGPIHGRRRNDDPGVEAMLAAFESHWRQAPGIEGMVADWRLALDAALSRGWANPDKIAWLGTSMGTAYGIPLCAAEPRIKGAAFGMWGTDWGQEDALIFHSQRMTTPALFQIKTEDEIFSIEGQRRLFHALGSSNKCLSTYSGGHSLTAPGQLDELLDFVGRMLACGSEPAAADVGGPPSA